MNTYQIAVESIEFSRIFNDIILCSFFYLSMTRSRIEQCVRFPFIRAYDIPAQQSVSINQLLREKKTKLLLNKANKDRQKRRRIYTKNC